MKRLIYVAMLMAVIGSCKKDDATNNNNNNNNTEKGTIKGVIYSANGLKTVAHAKITLDGSTQYQAESDAHGSFSMLCPTGTQHVTFTVGSGEIFKGDFTVTVTANQSIEVPHDSTTLEQEKQIAYVSGMWDSIQNIIRDSLGYNLTQLTDVDLANGNLNNYAIIFLNCGADFSMNTAIYNNLNTYLQNGGNIYASDYAIDYLVGDGNLKKQRDHNSHKTLSQSTPCSSSTNLLGGFIEDSLLCHDKVGNPGLINGATVQDSVMQTIFGPTVDLNYDLPSWVVLFHVETSDPRFKVLITDPNTYGPLLVSIKWGTGLQGGNIMYTTFHNEANVTTDMVDVLQWIVFNY